MFPSWNPYNFFLFLVSRASLWMVPVPFTSVQSAPTPQMAPRGGRASLSPHKPAATALYVAHDAAPYLTLLLGALSSTRCPAPYTLRGRAPARFGVLNPNQGLKRSSDAASLHSGHPQNPTSTHLSPSLS